MNKKSRAADRVPSHRFRWWHEIVLACLLIGLLGTAASMMPNFISVRSQLVLSNQLWEAAIVALPMTLIIISGGIDLSVGSTMGLCAVALGICHQASGNLLLSSAVCLLVGACCGRLNGILIARLEVHPLIITLATYAAYRGVAEGVSQGESYSQFGAAYGQLAGGRWYHIPLPAFIFCGLAMVMGVALARSPSGRFLYAMGHAERAARFSGINVRGIKTNLYTISGLLAGCAALIDVSRFDTAKADAGAGIELDVITAVVIGGTSIFGGRGNILGTILGLLLIHETKLFVGRYWQIEELKSISIGVLLIGSILVYRVLTPRSPE